jgi:hypothetical protein
MQYVGWTEVCIVEFISKGHIMLVEISRFYPVYVYVPTTSIAKSINWSKGNKVKCYISTSILLKSYNNINISSF